VLRTEDLVVLFCLGDWVVDVIGDGRGLYRRVVGTLVRRLEV
jgi:hypothetical protein